MMTNVIKKKETVPMGTEEVEEYGKFLKTDTSQQAAMDQEPGATGNSLVEAEFPLLEIHVPGEPGLLHRETLSQRKKRIIKIVMDLSVNGERKS